MTFKRGDIAHVDSEHPGALAPIIHGSALAIAEFLDDKEKKKKCYAIIDSFEAMKTRDVDVIPELIEICGKDHVDDVFARSNTLMNYKLGNPGSVDRPMDVVMRVSQVVRDGVRFANRARAHPSGE